MAICFTFSTGVLSKTCFHNLGKSLIWLLYFTIILIQKNLSFSKNSSTSPLISLHLLSLLSSNWSKIRLARCGNLCKRFSIVQFGLEIQTTKNEGSFEKLEKVLLYEKSWLDKLSAFTAVDIAQWLVLFDILQKIGGLFPFLILHCFALNYIASKRHIFSLNKYIIHLTIV